MRTETRPVARTLGETSLMVKVHPTLDPDRLAAMAQQARGVISAFQR